MPSSQLRFAPWLTATFDQKMKLHIALHGMVCLMTQAAFSADITVTDLTSKPETSYTYDEGDAEQISKAVQNLSWDGTSGARCHIPAYRLVRKESEKVILEATICFKCNNVRFVVPKEEGLKGFTMDHDKTRWLRQILESIFKEEKIIEPSGSSKPLPPAATEAG